jgi:amino acid adenylation domain-containing protein
MTRRDLILLAQTLAYRLIKIGIGPGDRVAIVMPRSAKFLATMLGIFASGAAYVPFDPEAPIARSARTLSEARVAAVIVSNETEALWLELSRVSGVQVKTFSIDDLSFSAEVNIAKPPTPETIAYVLFTSGSTGVPKGAMIEHRGMLNHMYAKIRDLELTSNDRIAQTAPSAFDVSVWQFLTGPLLGGQTIIYKPELAWDPLSLLRACQTDGVTVLEIVPSFMRVMLDCLDSLQPAQRPKLEKLRWLVVTGEAFPAALARRWQAHYGHVGLVNAYGPTECSDDVAHHLIFPGGTDLGEDDVPIGRPIANMKLFVLNEKGELVPQGVPGELYVAGIGVGKGYLNDIATTEKSFSVGLLPEFPDLHFYRTGDRVVMRPDGVLVFIGRTDDQIELSGHRIELGEIDTILEAVPGISQAITVFENDESSPTLASLLHLTPGVERDGVLNGARAAVMQALPSALRPARFVIAQEMPMLPSGKVDRRAARLLILSDRPQDMFYSEETILTRLREIWSRLLKRDKVHDSDKFYATGGTSLLLIAMQTEIRKAFAAEIELNELFCAETVPECASLIISTLKCASAPART